MSDRLLLRLAPDGGLNWLRHGAGVRPPESVAGPPPASVLAEAAEIVVLAPAEDVLLTEVRLSVRNRSQLMQALPYAVEDQLLAPVEELHFAAASEGDRVGVAAVAKERLRFWLDRLAEAGVHPDRLLPESLALPLAEGHATLLLEERRAIARLAPWSAFACTLAELPGWLAQLQGAGGLPPLEVRDFRAQSRLALAAPVAAYRERQRDALAWLASSASSPINLLEGEFAPRQRRARGVRRWRLAAALAAAVPLLAVAGLGLEVLQLARTSARLQVQAEDAVRSAFPDVDAAQLARVDPERLMRGRLERLRGGSEAGGLLQRLGQLAPVLGSATRVQTRGMEYRNGGFELALRAPDVATVDGVRERLAVAGLKAEVTAANPGADGVDGRIRIGGPP